jgi:hypothetical protein
VLTRAQLVVASAAALFALVLLVGTAVFLAAREEEPAPTTTTTSTTAPLTEEDVAAALAESLQADLAVAITIEEARCVAAVVVAVVPPDALGELVDRSVPLSGVSEAQREELVRGVVGCVPEASAAALLGAGTSTTTAVSLPGESDG